MPPKVPPPQTLLLCLVFAGLLFLLDLYTHLGIADGVLYAFVVALSFWLPSPRDTVLVAGSCTGLIILGFFFSPPGDVSYGIANRALAIGTLWLTALFSMNRAAALAVAENRYHDLVGSIHAIVWRCDSKTFRFTFVSPHAETILGYPVRRWIEEPAFWQDCIVDEDRERVLASCAEATRQGGNHRFDYRMVAADGRIVWLSDYVNVIMANGEPKESIGVMVDITEEKHANEAVGHNEERYQALLDVSRDAIFVSCGDRIVSINDCGLRLFRATSSDQIIGHSPLEFFHPDFHEVIRERIRRIMETGMPSEVLEEQIVCLDGTVVDVEVAAARITDAGMPPIQVILRDITKRRLAEREREVLIHTLGERVKELTLLQKVGRLVQDHDTPVDETLRNIVSLIPSGFQYPDICAARIVGDGVICTSEKFSESPWVLRSNIYFNGTKQGEIEVVYLKERGDEVEGPFLIEERNLLNGLAEQCAIYLKSKQTLAALHHSEARFRESAEQTRSMMDALPVLVAYVDREHRYQQNNEGYRRWFGANPASLQGRHLQDVLGTTAYEAIKPKIEAALRGELVEFEAELPYAKGGIRNVHVVYVPHRDTHGSVLGFYGLVQDVSSRKKAEEALMQSEERQRKIVSVLAEGVVLHDSTGAIVSCNSRAEQILDLSAEQMIGRTLFDLRWQAIHEDGSLFSESQHPAMHTLRTGEPCTNVIMGVERPTVGLSWISINTMPLFRNDELVPYGVVSSFQDVTQRKEAESALQTLLNELEQRVLERTAELREANAALVKEIAQRQEMEAALRRSESGLAAAQRITQMGSWELDLVDGSLNWSQEIYRVFEIDPRKFSASYEAFLNAVHPDDRTLVNEAFTKSVQHRTPYEIVHRLQMPDGRIKYVQERGETYYDAEGRPQRSVGTVQDITERQEDKLQLQRSQTLLHSVFAHLPNMVFVKDARTLRFVEFNKAGEVLTGFSREELLGKSDYDLFPREEADFFTGKDRSVLASGSLLEIREEEIKTKDRGIRFLQTKKVPIYDARGIPQYLLGISEDVTERKRAEQSLLRLHAELEERVRVRTSELSETNSRLEAEIIDHATAKETLQRRDAILQAVSYAAKQFLLTISWESQLIDVLQRLGEGAAVDHACVFRNHRAKDGDLRTSLQAEWVAQGVPSRVNDTRLQDVSYRAQGLERWERELSRGFPICGSVADLSQAERIMMGIRGQRSIVLVPIVVGQEWWGMMVFGMIQAERSWQAAEIEALQVAASTLGAGIQRQRMEQEIRLYTEELEKLITQRTDRIRELEGQRAQAEKLAALGQLAAGVAHEINNPIAGIKNAFLLLKDGIPREHPHYHFVGMIEREIERVATIVRRMYELYRDESQQVQVVALDTLMEDLAYLLKPKLTQRKISLQSHLLPTIPPFRLVQRDLLQVLLNLVQNAVEASPENGLVVVSVTHDHDHVAFSVSDEGCGISRDEQPHIFEPFFSGHHKRKQGGMGLGLSVSYNLVQAMGGRIDVVSQPSKGATFIVTLPLTPTPHITAQTEGET